MDEDYHAGPPDPADADGSPIRVEMTTESGTFHTSRDVSQGQQIHEGKREDCDECSPRVHLVELLSRAAALIDPDSEAVQSYEARLDWLAKWRETVGR